MRYYIGKIPLLIINIYDNIRLIKNFFFDRIPVKSNNLSCKPFLIISSGRSGTTLLRIMLTKNSQISIPPESQFLHTAIRKFRSYNYLGWDELIKIIIGELESKKIFQHWDIKLSSTYVKLKNIRKGQRSLAKIIDEIYSQFLRKKNPKAKVWGDKTPLNIYYYKWINKIFPDIKYINLVRDGRAVVNSLLQKKYPKSTLNSACKRWNESIHISKKIRNNKPENLFLQIKYENLVSSPQDEIEKLCSFLDINYEDSMLNNTKHIEKFGDSILPHHKNLKKPINTNSINKWKTELSEEQKKKITEKIRDNLLYLGYLN